MCDVFSFFFFSCFFFLCFCFRAQVSWKAWCLPFHLSLVSFFFCFHYFLVFALKRQLDLARVKRRFWECAGILHFLCITSSPLHRAACLFCKWVGQLIEGRDVKILPHFILKRNCTCYHQWSSGLVTKVGVDSDSSVRANIMMQHKPNVLGANVCALHNPKIVVF